MTTNADQPAMTTRQSYDSTVRSQLETLVDTLKLDALHKQMLKRRWLDQVLWMEGRAGKAKNRYYFLRLITIIGGVLIPVCTTLSQTNTWAGFAWLATVLGAVVAIAATIDGFCRDGERWRHYRTIVETLKSEGWRFLQLTGYYSQYSTHQDAYENFAQNVEEILKEDVNRFITEIASKPGEKDQAEDTSVGRTVEPEIAARSDDKPVEPGVATNAGDTPTEPDSSDDDLKVTARSVEP